MQNEGGNLNAKRVTLIPRISILHFKFSVLHFSLSLEPRKFHHSATGVSSPFGPDRSELRGRRDRCVAAAVRWQVFVKPHPAAAVFGGSRQSASSVLPIRRFRQAFAFPWEVCRARRSDCRSFAAVLVVHRRATPFARRGSSVGASLGEEPSMESE